MSKNWVKTVDFVLTKRAILCSINIKIQLKILTFNILKDNINEICQLLISQKKEKEKENTDF